MTSTVLITGASSGIGRATAVRFADEGWNVVATMRNPADGGALPDRSGVLVARLDVLDGESIEDYQPLVRMLTDSLSEDDAVPTGAMQPADCADVIWRAATHDGDRLRFAAGAGAEQLLATRYDAEREEAFLARSRAQFGV